jgi:hypothetical protein
MKGLNPGLVALHQHWVIADAVRYHGQKPSEETGGLPPELAKLGAMASAFGILRVWYALLFVVVEGYQELQLSDDAVDALLADEGRVDALRRLRNATFHYQSDPFTPKLWDYLMAPGSEAWIHDLNAALQSYFENALGIAKFFAALGKP